MSNEVQIDLREVTEYLKGVQNRISNMSSAMANVAGSMEDSVHQRFEDKSDGTTKWKSLSPKTIQDRQRKGYTPATNILVRSRQLENSISSRYTSHSAEVGSNLPQAVAHNLGLRVGKNKSVQLPKREFLSITNREFNEMKDILTNFIKK